MCIAPIFLLCNNHKTENGICCHAVSTCQFARSRAPWMLRATHKLTTQILPHGICWSSDAQKIDWLVCPDVRHHSPRMQPLYPSMLSWHRPFFCFHVVFFVMVSACGTQSFPSISPNLLQIHAVAIRNLHWLLLEYFLTSNQPRRHLWCCVWCSLLPVMHPESAAKLESNMHVCVIILLYWIFILVDRIKSSSTNRLFFMLTILSANVFENPNPSSCVVLHSVISISKYMTQMIRWVKIHIVRSCVYIRTNVFVFWSLLDPYFTWTVCMPKFFLVIFGTGCRLTFRQILLCCV